MYVHERRCRRFVGRARMPAWFNDAAPLAVEGQRYHYISYSLYQDSDAAAVWGNTAGTGVSIPAAAGNRHQVYVGFGREEPACRKLFHTVVADSHVLTSNQTASHSRVQWLTAAGGSPSVHGREFTYVRMIKAYLNCT